MPSNDICLNFKTVKIVTGSLYLEGEKWCGAESGYRGGGSLLLTK
jgi:hypothetical protein